MAPRDPIEGADAAPGEPDATASAVRRLDRRLLADLDEVGRRAATAAGTWLRCGPGCSDCCLAPFPVTRLDAGRLREGLDALRRCDPQRAAAIERRAGLALERLRPGFPGDFATGRIDDDVERLDAFFERHAALACPVLDPASGRCELYDERPVACRTFGPPTRLAGRDVDPCRLCFRGADTATVERCRVEPDRAGLETRILGLLGIAPGADWETLITFVVAPRVLR